jgi:hypothetical protein
VADLRTIYEQGMVNVSDIDEKLDSLTDQETAGKRKVSNDLVEASRDKWEPFSTQAVKQMADMPPEVLAGVYLGIQKILKDEFDKNVSEFITSQVSNMPPVEPLISEEEAESLRKVRSSLYQQIKSVRELAIQVGEATEEDEAWKMPKMRRGAHGKRGKRALSLYTWFFNGEEIDDVTTVREVAAHLGYEKAADFTQALRDADIDTRNPPDQFTFNHPSGVIVTAEKDVDDENGDEDEDEEDTDEEVAEEETPTV